MEGKAARAKKTSQRRSWSF